jgi:uncharacterized protein YfaT (DUF1175 family)
MKQSIKKSLIKLPRSFRILWGRIFIYMLGRIGTDEFYNDVVLYNELRKWIDTQGRPTTSNINYYINK